MRAGSRSVAGPAEFIRIVERLEHASVLGQVVTGIVGVSDRTRRWAGACWRIRGAGVAHLIDGRVSVGASGRRDRRVRGQLVGAVAGVGRREQGIGALLVADRHQPIRRVEGEGVDHASCRWQGLGCEVGVRIVTEAGGVGQPVLD